jgi:hypothetical protein
MTRPAIDRLKAFVVDNDPSQLAYWHDYTTWNPDCGIEIVGQCDFLPDDLPDRVRKSGARLVLLDVHFGGTNLNNLPPDNNGFDAAQKLRDVFGTAIKIVLMSAFPHLRQRALDAPVDGFLEKEGMEDMIKKLMAGIPPSPSARPAIVRLELTPGRRQARLLDAEGRPFILQLQAASYALLWYLVEQRQAGERDWLTRPPHQLRTDVRYTVRRSDRWRYMVVTLGVNAERARVDSIKASAVNDWTFQINREARGCCDDDLIDSSQGAPTARGGRVLLREIAVAIL